MVFICLCQQRLNIFLKQTTMIETLVVREVYRRPNYIHDISQTKLYSVHVYEQNRTDICVCM